MSCQTLVAILVEVYVNEVQQIKIDNLKNVVVCTHFALNKIK